MSLDCIPAKHVPHFTTGVDHSEVFSNYNKVGTSYKTKITGE